MRKSLSIYGTLGRSTDRALCGRRAQHQLSQHITSLPTWQSQRGQITYLDPRIVDPHHCQQITNALLVKLRKSAAPFPCYIYNHCTSVKPLAPPISVSLACVLSSVMSAEQSSTGPGALVIQEYGSIRIANYCVNAAYALLVYEHAVTFRQEVELFWRRKAHGATVLFFSNRYLVLAYYTLSIFGYIPICIVYVRAITVVNFLLYLPWAVFTALRAFALSRNSFLAVFVFLLSVVTIGVDFVNYGFGLTGINDPLAGCTAVTPIPPSLAHNLTIASRTCLITADIVLIIMTWKVTYYQNKGVRSALGQRSLSFAEVLLRDGTVLLVLNSAHLACTLLSIKPTLQTASYVTVFTGPVTAVLVSRFLLDLQAAHRDATNGGLESLDARQSESVVFGRVIGSIGSSLPPRGSRK
ncbi:hypothetical protein C8Q80DRAFT_1158198 [Daedaleopsis nitida]|nr:hypothetical protein C8Q80DRAFT_1158198 [Daedaleopsis nitida]